MSHTKGPSRTWLAFAGFLAIAAFFLTTEHRAHVFGVLPFLLLAACPLLHMFGHGGHGGHGERREHGQHGEHGGQNDD
jgi:hypothetical protein